MPTYSCRVNGRAATLHSWDPNQPLLYALRSSLGLTGTKAGCRLGLCGTCTVLLDDQAVRSCGLLATRPRHRVDEQRLESLEIMDPFVVAQRDADDAGRGVARDPD
jgi:aerobic-type carbon monoxide dehydrogenase small subunit (CoxS/CutS family)